MYQPISAAKHTANGYSAALVQETHVEFRRQPGIDKPAREEVVRVSIDWDEAEVAANDGAITPALLDRLS